MSGTKGVEVCLQPPPPGANIQANAEEPAIGGQRLIFQFLIISTDPIPIQVTLIKLKNSRGKAREETGSRPSYSDQVP